MEWRFFKEDDLEWILKATKDMFDESEWNDGEYDKEKIKRYFYRVIDNPLYMFGIIVMKGEEKVGFMTGEIIQFSFMKDFFARESELYMIPSERGKMGAVIMMKKFMEWAKSNKAREVYAIAKRLGMKKEAKYRRII